MPAQARRIGRRGGRPPQGALDHAGQEGPGAAADATSGSPSTNRSATRPSSTARWATKRTTPAPVPHARQAGQDPDRRRPRQLPGRPHPAREPVDLRLRRRRREDHASSPSSTKGIFVGYQTIREQAHLVGAEASTRLLLRRFLRVASRSSACPTCGWSRAEAGSTLDDLISGVDDGMLIDGRGVYSIDQQRYNFQFGGDAFWEIKGGKKRGHGRATWPTRAARPTSGRPATAWAGKEHLAERRAQLRRQGAARRRSTP